MFDLGAVESVEGNLLAFFPFGLSGRVRLNGNTYDVARVVSRIEDMLDDASASTVTTDGSKIVFTAGLFRMVGNWNALVQFSSGEIWLEPEPASLTIRYRLSTLQLFLIATALVVTACILVRLPLSIGEIEDRVRLCAFAWLWLFGVNYFIGMVRFPLWLKWGLKPTIEPA